MIQKIPLFTRKNGDSFEIDDGVFVTIKHIRGAILELFPDLCDEYIIHRAWKSERVVRKYAWNSIIDILNKRGDGPLVINKLIDE